MTVETALYPNQLNASWPAQSDIVREGAGHLRTVKTVFRTTFPNVSGAVTPTHVELNYMVGVTSGVQAQINTKGAIAGQTWTGTHVFPSTTTVGPLTPTIQGYLATVTSDAQAQINTKAAKAGDTYTGAHNFGGATSVTLPAVTSIGSVSDVELGYLDGVTAPIQSQLAGKADINGASYTGTHDFTGATVQVATQPAGTSNTTPASTAFVAAAALSTALPGQAGNAGKFVTTDGSNASWAYPYPQAVAVTGTSQLAVAGPLYCLQNAAASTLTLPAAPADGDIVAVKAENLRLDNVIARNGNLLMGVAQDMTIDNPHFPIVLQFRTTFGWRLIA